MSQRIRREELESYMRGRGYWFQIHIQDYSKVIGLDVLKPNTPRYHIKIESDDLSFPNDVFEKI